MREALRGALLSVLFFALILGGAPSMVAAEGDCVVSGSCNGDTTPVPKKHRSGKSKEQRHQEYCDSMKAGMGVGTGTAAVGGTIAVFGGPPGWAVGSFLGGMAAITVTVFGAGYVLGGCFR